MNQAPEILAPAGDEAGITAALKAGADAVYFGLAVGFNARTRAENVAIEQLSDVMQRIHESGRRGYVTLNTLVFDGELERFEQIVHRVADAGVDAVIVQDLGAARWIKSLYPTLRLHASTQMTCTDQGAVEFAGSLGANRVTLARELSFAEIEQLVQRSSLELEVFAHGALCVSYSGQCLTSEAIGGRSANRGACAQACRLPYGLVVDGRLCDLGDKDYLLSPKDLDASQHVGKLLATGVAAIKIEGRLKSREYIAATTLLYRQAVDAVLGRNTVPSPLAHEASLQAFSRGSSLGFLEGTDHQQLVDGTTCDHIGILAGKCTGLVTKARKTWLRLVSSCELRRGDGILIQSGHGEHLEFGARIWALSVGGSEVEQATPASDVLIWLGPDKLPFAGLVHKTVFRTSSPKVTATLDSVLSENEAKLPLKAKLRGAVGERPILTVATADGRTAEVILDCHVELAQSRPLDEKTAFEKLSRLGDTPYVLTELAFELVPGSTLALSSLNRARRDAIVQLAQAAKRTHVVVSGRDLASPLDWPEQAFPTAGLFVTCRNLEQAEAAITAGANGVYLDFLALTGMGPAFRTLRERTAGSVGLGIALPRIRRLGEEKIDRYVYGLQPDAILLRSLGSLSALEQRAVDEASSIEAVSSTVMNYRRPVVVADFSVNVANSLSAIELLRRNVQVFTPSYDLDAAQLEAMLDSPLAPYAEVVVYHPMPLFHMEHCVIAARLSSGKSYRDCGRPCEQHQVSLRDRTGLLLPVEADVGCRNTVFHGRAQSAAEQVPALIAQGVSRFRVELVRENAQNSAILVRSFRELIDGVGSPAQLRQQLAVAGLSAVRGSLRVVG